MIPGVKYIKEWIQGWILWIWLIFIGFLACRDAENSNLIGIVEEGQPKSAKPKVKKKKVKSKKCKKLAVGTDKDVLEVSLSPSGHNLVQEDLEEGQEGDEGFVKVSLSVGSVRTKENEKSQDNISDVNKQYENVQNTTFVTNSVLRQDLYEEDEDMNSWVGAGRGGGLTRYPGLQNLVTPSKIAEEYQERLHRPANLLSRRDGPLLLPVNAPRGLPEEDIEEYDIEMVGKSIDNRNENPDELWAELVSRYTAEESEKDSTDKVKSTTIENKTQVEEEKIIAKEFSAKLEEKLEQYLAKVEESCSDDENYVISDDTRELEREIGDALIKQEICKDNSIFFVFEDNEESENRYNENSQYCIDDKISTAIEDTIIQEREMQTIEEENEVLVEMTDEDEAPKSSSEVYEKPKEILVEKIKNLIENAAMEVNNPQEEIISEYISLQPDCVSLMPIIDEQQIQSHNVDVQENVSLFVDDVSKDTANIKEEDPCFHTCQITRQEIRVSEIENTQPVIVISDDNKHALLEENIEVLKHIEDIIIKPEYAQSDVELRDFTCKKEFVLPIIDEEGVEIQLSDDEECVESLLINNITEMKATSEIVDNVLNNANINLNETLVIEVEEKNTIMAIDKSSISKKCSDNEYIEQLKEIEQQMKDVQYALCDVEENVMNDKPTIYRNEVDTLIMEDIEVSNKEENININENKLVSDKDECSILNKEINSLKFENSSNEIYPTSKDKINKLSPGILKNTSAIRSETKTNELNLKDLKDMENEVESSNVVEVGERPPTPPKQTTRNKKSIKSKKSGELKSMPYETSSNIFMEQRNLLKRNKDKLQNKRENDASIQNETTQENLSESNTEIMDNASLNSTEEEPTAKKLLAEEIVKDTPKYESEMKTDMETISYDIKSNTFLTECDANIRLDTFNSTNIQNVNEPVTLITAAKSADEIIDNSNNLNNNTSLKLDNEITELSYENCDKNANVFDGAPVSETVEEAKHPYSLTKCNEYDKNYLETDFDIDVSKFSSTDNINDNELEGKVSLADDVPISTEETSISSTRNSTSVSAALDIDHNLIEALEDVVRKSDKRTGDDDENIPDYLEDVKDLLVPRARRKKARRRVGEFEEVFKIDETKLTGAKLDEKPYDEKLPDISDVIWKSSKDTSTNLELSKFEKNLQTYMDLPTGLTQEGKEDVEVKTEQEIIRVAQMKELEKYLAMPAGLTEQEQREFSDIISEEEADKAAAVESEARLAVLLASIRVRHEDLEDDVQKMERFMNLPVKLTEEEEKLLNEGDDKGDYKTDEEYREYIRQKYLSELEEDRIRAEDEEYEFAEYYDDEYDYDYDYECEDDVGDEYVMLEETSLIHMKDEAVGPEEPMQVEASVEVKPKKKKRFSLSALRSQGSRDSQDSKSSRESTKNGSEDNKKKKFFRLRGLGTRKNKSNAAEPLNKQPVLNNYNSGCGAKAADKSFNRHKSNIPESYLNPAMPSLDTQETFDSSIENEVFVNQMNIKNARLNNQSSQNTIKPNEISYSNAFATNIATKINNANLQKKNFNSFDKPSKTKELFETSDDHLIKINSISKSISIPTSFDNENKLTKEYDNEELDKDSFIEDKYVVQRKIENCIDNVTSTINSDKNLSSPLIKINKTHVTANNNNSSRLAPQKSNTVDCEVNNERNSVSEHMYDSSRSQDKLSDSPSININSAAITKSLNGAVNMSESGVASPDEGMDVAEEADQGGFHVTEGAEPNGFDATEGAEPENDWDTPWPDETTTTRSGPTDADLNAEFLKDVLDEEDGERIDDGNYDENKEDNQMNGTRDKGRKSNNEKKGKKKKKRKDDKKAAYQHREDLYEKKIGPRVRSFDAAKMRGKFNKPKEPTQVSSDCRMCGKQVFQMEKIVAEKASWHKNCFRCTQCNKNLTLETYQSHEGSLYCKPHFKELFRPKAVVVDEAEERRERPTSKPDYGLDELHQTMDVKQRFAMFESIAKEEEEPRPEPVSVKRSQSLLSKAARFLEGGDTGDYGIETSQLGDFEEDEDEEEEGNENDDPNIVRSNRRRKERPLSFSGLVDIKAAFEQKQRREEMSSARKEEISRFRQMLCAGKNSTLKDLFESGALEQGDDERPREAINIEGKRAARNLREKFERGQPFIMEEEDDEGHEEDDGEEGGRGRRRHYVGEGQEVEEIFREAETAKKARNVFKQIDSNLTQEDGLPLLRAQSFSQNKENRLSQNLQHHPSCGHSDEVVKANEKKDDDFHVETTDLVSRFKFFATYERRQQEEKEKKRKVFRMTPPREDTQKVEDPKANMPKACMKINCAVCRLRGLEAPDDLEIGGRDPNLIKSSDNYEDEVDCKNTRNLLQMFKKMEMGEEEEEEDDREVRRPLKRFTPPPEGEEYGEDSEEDDEDYTDEEEEEEEEEGSSYDEGDERHQYKDELLEMSAKKAAHLRAKFERWEAAEMERQNESLRSVPDEDECMPSLDTARNLKAMFESKAIEESKPLLKPQAKVNRFVGGGDVCAVCNKTVYIMEKLEIVGQIMHRNCFKCARCNSTLRIESFSVGGDKMYCPAHYKQIFTEKGSYDAFMTERENWARKIEQSNETIKSQE